MKPKLLINAMLLAALAAASWWLFHSSERAKVRAISEMIVAPTNTSVHLASANPVPIHVHQLKVVDQSPSNPEVKHEGNWSVVKTIIDENASYELRLAAMDKLFGPLNDNDWSLLKAYLLTSRSQDQIQRNQVLKNRLLDVLCAMNPPPSELGNVLAQMYQDEKQTKVIRDYAVQHMSAYYEQAGQTTNAAAIQEVLWKATSETSDTIGGTALLALQRLSNEYTNFDRNKIASTALQMAQNLASTEPAQITAYQVCAQLNVPQALPIALTAAQNGQTIPIKMSAIAALGQLGGPEQIPFLNSVLAGSEDRLKPAAQTALEKINLRVQLANQR